MVQIGPTVQATQDPTYITYNKCLEILQSTQSGLTVWELFNAACKHDQHIREFIGSRSYSTSVNRKVRTVVDMLRNHSKVKMTGVSPLVLQWMEVKPVTDYDDSDEQDDNRSQFDKFDMCDTTKNENKIEIENKINFDLSHTSNMSNSNQNPIPEVKVVNQQRPISVLYAKSMIVNSILPRRMHYNDSNFNCPDAKALKNLIESRPDSRPGRIKNENR